MTGSLPAAEITKPNVLFLMVDDLRPELGCYGSVHVISPNIDRLAARGLVFDRAYCQQAHCMSSRFSMLSGCRPDTGEIWTNTDVREQLADKVFLPRHFKNHGYHTVGLGKIAHNGLEDEANWSEPHRMPANASYEYRTRAGRKLVESMQREALEAGRPDPFRDVPEKIRRGMPFESLEVDDDDDLGDGQLATEAISALGQIGDRPFFLGVGFLRPHLPFVAPKAYWDLYEADSLPLVDRFAAPSGIPGLSANDSRELRTQYRDVPLSGPLSEALARDLRHGYLACVSYVDAQIGRILEELDRRGLHERTIVVLASDHGFHLGELGLWGKGTNFELSTRSTLIVHAPAMKAAGKRTESLVELVGLYPTLCDLAGLPRPEHLQGTSFAVLLDEAESTVIPGAFSQYPRGDNMGRSIRTTGYRLVEWRNRESGALVGRELYDHGKDPEETVNLAGDPANEALIRDLSAAHAQP